MINEIILQYIRLSIQNIQQTQNRRFDAKRFRMQSLDFTVILALKS
jgi:hypothetical protein